MTRTTQQRSCRACAPRASRCRPHLVAVVSGSLGATSVNLATLRPRREVAHAGHRDAVPRDGSARRSRWSRERKLEEGIGDDTWRVVDFELRPSPTCGRRATSRSAALARTRSPSSARPGVPSVLVALPGAPGDHQNANARVLERRRGGRRARRCGAVRCRALDDMLSGAARRPSAGCDAMSQRRGRSRRPDAAARVAEVVLDQCALSRSASTRRWRVHVVGVGGAGMSGLARLLQGLGHTVTGSDLVASPTVEALRAAGIRRRRRPRGGRTSGAADLVTCSPAVPGDNVELLAALDRGAAWSPRAPRCSVRCARCARLLAIAGTHGKTTTSSMLTLILDVGRPLAVLARRRRRRRARRERAPRGGPRARAGGRRELRDVRAPRARPVRADERRGRPPRPLRDARRAPRGVRLAPRALRAGGRERGRPRRRGRSAARSARSASARTRLRTSWSPTCGSERASSTFTLRARGRIGRGASRRTGAAQRRERLDRRGGRARARRGVAATSSRRSSRFAGVPRRFEFRGEAHGATIVDDYAHLPGEVAVAVAAARDGRVAPRRRGLPAPPLHADRRARRLVRRVPSTASDLVVVTDVYSAGEPPLPGVTGRLVADAVAAAPGAPPTCAT